MRRSWMLGAGACLVLMLPSSAEGQAPPVPPFDRGGAGADEPRVSDPPELRRSTRRILGEVPMTAADSMRQRIVERLDFDSYKELVRSLTVFGDREQGTPRNEAANDWIEQTLQSWGYETERLHYEFTPRVPVTVSRFRSGRAQEPGVRDVGGRDEPG